MESQHPIDILSPFSPPARALPFTSWRGMFTSEVSVKPSDAGRYDIDKQPRLDPAKRAGLTSFISPSMTVEHVVNGSRTSFSYFHAVASDALIDWIRNHMLDLERDSIRFEVLVFPGRGDLRVYAKYNLIIGSRLLAELPVGELPECMAG